MPGSWTRNAELAMRLLRMCASQSEAARIVPDRCCSPSPAALEFLRSRQIDSLHELSVGEPSARQQVYDLVWQKQLAAAREVVAALLSAGIRVLVFKGGELIPRHFHSHAIGFIGDIDLLVERPQTEIARSVLYQLGYKHRVFDPVKRILVDRDVIDTARAEVNHYELAPMFKALAVPDVPGIIELTAKNTDQQQLYVGADGPVLLSAIDVHHNVATDIDPTPLLARAVPSATGPGETLSPADHVWLNLTRHYNEVSLHDSISLRPIAYTLPEIAAGGVDWAVVERTAVELALGPTLYYFLALCDRLAFGHIPASTIVAVRESTQSRARDWGWQVGKLFDFDESFPIDLRDHVQRYSTMD